MYYAFTLFKDFHVLVSSDGSGHLPFSVEYNIFPQPSPVELLGSAKIRVPYIRSSADVVMDLACLAQNANGEDGLRLLLGCVETLHLPISLDERCRAMWPMGFHPCSPEPGHLSVSDYAYAKSQIEELDGPGRKTWWDFSEFIDKSRIRFIDRMGKAVERYRGFSEGCARLADAITTGKFDSELGRLAQTFEALKGSWKPLSVSTLQGAFTSSGFFPDVYIEDLTEIMRSYEEAKRSRTQTDKMRAHQSHLINLLSSPKYLATHQTKPFWVVCDAFKTKFSRFLNCLEELGIPASTAINFSAVLEGYEAWQDDDGHNTFSKLMVPCAWIGDSPLWAFYLQDSAIDKAALTVKPQNGTVSVFDLIRGSVDSKPTETFVMQPRLTVDATPVSVFLVCCADILHRMGHQFDPAVGSVFVRPECLTYANCLCGSARQSYRLASIIYLVFEAWRSCEIAGYKPNLDSIADPELRGIVDRVLA